MAETASTTTTTTTVVATSQQESSPQQPPQNNPFVFLFNIPQCLVNKFMNFNNKRLQNKGETEKSVKRVDSEETCVKNPEIVRFPSTKNEVGPLKLETEDVPQDTNPIILWQVYALGGFILVKWAWGKWQERKANAKPKEDSPDDEDDPPADD